MLLCGCQRYRHCTHNCRELQNNAIGLCESTAEQMYGCKVRTIVTDNAKNVEKMRKEMEKEDSNLVTYSNLSHVLNLLGQDLTPASVVKRVTEVNKFFKNHHVPTAWLRDQLGATRPQLPNDTRLKGQLICLDSFLTNRMYYIKFIHDHPDEMEGTITQKVNDINLFRQLSDLAKMLRPVAIALDKGQNDNATIADACEIFLFRITGPQCRRNLTLPSSHAILSPTCSVPNTWGAKLANCHWSRLKQQRSG